MMRLASLIALLFLGSFSWAADPAWPPLPPGTLTVFLGTGQDQAMVAPLGCNRGGGGADFRDAFDAWLGQCDPSLERIWISSGNIGQVKGRESTGTTEEILKVFQNTGYRAVAVSVEDLQNLGVDFFRLARGTPLPFFSANVMVHETGKTLFPPFLILNSRAGKIGLIGCTQHIPEFVTGVPEVGTVVTVPAIPAIRDAVSVLKAQVEKIVLVSTVPFLELAELLRDARGIDLVLANWGLYQTPQPQIESGIPILWLGGMGMGIGRWALGTETNTLDLQTVSVKADFPGKSFDLPPCPDSSP